MTFPVFGHDQQGSASSQSSSTSSSNGTFNGANGHPAVNGNGNGRSHTSASPSSNRFRPIPATLSAGVSIKGTVKFRSELVIDGEVEGTIEAVGRLTVGRNGHVRGDIRTRSVTVHGTIDGNLSAGEKCELRSGCTLRGDIETSRLVVDENVNFTGSAAIATQDYLSEMRCPNGSERK